jgi:hypothetical protein
VEQLLEGKELLFHPQLVAKAGPRGGDKQSAERRRKEEELIQYGRMLDQKKQMARVVQEQYAESQFDFVPKINRKSERIVLEKAKYQHLTATYHSY